MWDIFWGDVGNMKTMRVTTTASPPSATTTTATTKLLRRRESLWMEESVRQKTELASLMHKIGRVSLAIPL